MVYAELHERAKRATAVGFLRAVIEAFPYGLHTVLTDNGIQFTNRAQDRYAFRHLFDRVCGGARDRAPADEAEPPVDERAGRADEPDAQGGDGEAVPLREPRGAA